MQQHSFHLVTPSPWPILAALGAFMITTGGVMYMHLYKHGGLLLSFGLFFLISILFVWWRDVIRESTWEGAHTRKVESLMYNGMALFIMSEVMFFCAFFCMHIVERHFQNLRFSTPTGIYPPPDLYYHLPNVWFALYLVFVLAYSAYQLDKTVRLKQIINAENVIESKYLVWARKYLRDPEFDTVYQLTVDYGVGLSDRVKFARHYENNVIFETMGRLTTKRFFKCIAFGTLFLSLQVAEYAHSSFSINQGLYASCFYMITGFHGFHVAIGLCFIVVCYIRHLARHNGVFTSVAVDLARWYWHFVDIVWMYVYAVVYVDNTNLALILASIWSDFLSSIGLNPFLTQDMVNLI